MYWPKQLQKEVWEKYRSGCFYRAIRIHTGQALHQFHSYLCLSNPCRPHLLFDFMYLSHNTTHIDKTKSVARGKWSSAFNSYERGEYFGTGLSVWGYMGSSGKRVILGLEKKRKHHGKPNKCTKNKQTCSYDFRGLGETIPHYPKRVATFFTYFRLFYGISIFGIFRFLKMPTNTPEQLRPSSKHSLSTLRPY